MSVLKSYLFSIASFVGPLWGAPHSVEFKAANEAAKLAWFLFGPSLSFAG